MSQQLNLVNLALLPPKPFFQFRSMMLALTVMVSVLVVFSALIFSQVSAYEQAAGVSAQRLLTTQARVAALEEKSGKREVSPTVADEQIAVEADRQRLETLAGQIAQLGGKKAVRSRAALLFALAQRPAKGLWLTGVTIDGERVALDGMTVEAADLPLWLAQLQQLPAFAGQRFGGLEIGQSTGQEGGPQEAADSASAPRPVAALAFHLTAVPAGRAP